MPLYDAHPCSVPASPTSGAAAGASPFAPSVAPAVASQGAWRGTGGGFGAPVSGHSDGGAAPRARLPADSQRDLCGRSFRLSLTGLPGDGLSRQHSLSARGAVFGDAGCWFDPLLSPPRDAAATPSLAGGLHERYGSGALETAVAEGALPHRARDDLDLLGRARPALGGAAMWRPGSPTGTATESLGALDRCFAAAGRSRSPPCPGVAHAASESGLLSPHVTASERAYGAQPQSARASLEQPPWRSGDGDMGLCLADRRHAHDAGLHALRPGPFYSGRSIAAEWLQVPAVPLLPGTQCHDDAMVPGATGWTRRGGSGRRRPNAGRSLSLASRNPSASPFMLPADVLRLGVASSFASECSEWLTSQREGAQSWAGTGAPRLNGSMPAFAGDGMSRAMGAAEASKEPANRRDSSSRENASLHAHE